MSDHNKWEHFKYNISVTYELSLTRLFFTSYSREPARLTSNPEYVQIISMSYSDNKSDRCWDLPQSGVFKMIRMTYFRSKSKPNWLQIETKLTPKPLQNQNQNESKAVPLLYYQWINVHVWCLLRKWVQPFWIPSSSCIACFAFSVFC